MYNVADNSAQKLAQTTTLLQQQRAFSLFHKESDAFFRGAPQHQ